MCLWKENENRSRLTRKVISVQVSLRDPSVGWAASFIEATFSDGFVATSRVYVYPDSRYPNAAPPSKAPYCQTLPAR
jgi:PhoPQ-activated pathogenicity-related protein